MQTNNKLREALEIVAKQLTDATEDENFGEDVMYLVGCMRTMSQKCRAALAEPVKNCEVGTVGEQSERLHAYCKSHRCLYCSSGNGDECKFYRPGMKTDCKIEWANAPYESEVAK